jgi:hypothetical protein
MRQKCARLGQEYQRFSDYARRGWAIGSPRGRGLYHNTTRLPHLHPHPSLPTPRCVEECNNGR